jgi:hypothetical protein
MGEFARGGSRSNEAVNAGAWTNWYISFNMYIGAI